MNTPKDLFNGATVSSSLDDENPSKSTVAMPTSLSPLSSSLKGYIYRWREYAHTLSIHPPDLTVTQTSQSITLTLTYDEEGKEFLQGELCDETNGERYNEPHGNVIQQWNLSSRPIALPSAQIVAQGDGIAQEGSEDDWHEDNWHEDDGGSLSIPPAALLAPYKLLLKTDCIGRANSVSVWKREMGMVKSDAPLLSAMPYLPFALIRTVEADAGKGEIALSSVWHIGRTVAWGVLFRYPTPHLSSCLSSRCRTLYFLLPLRTYAPLIPAFYSPRLFASLFGGKKGESAARLITKTVATKTVAEMDSISLSSTSSPLLPRLVLSTRIVPEQTISEGRTALEHSATTHSSGVSTNASVSVRVALPLLLLKAAKADADADDDGAGNGEVDEDALVAKSTLGVTLPDVSASPIRLPNETPFPFPHKGILLRYIAIFKVLDEVEAEVKAQKKNSTPESTAEEDEEAFAVLLYRCPSSSQFSRRPSRCFCVVSGIHPRFSVRL